MIFPWDVFKKLSNDNKVQFWAITSSCFVALFTFCIGLTYQYFVVDESKEETKRLSHAQYIESVKPIISISRIIDSNLRYYEGKINILRDTIGNLSNRQLKELPKGEVVERNAISLTDSIYNFALEVNKSVEFPKYFLYDDLRDNVKMLQDSLEQNASVYKVANLIFESENIDRDSLYSKVNEILLFSGSQEKKLRSSVDVIKSKSREGKIVVKLKLAQNMVGIIMQINDILKESLPDFKKTSENKATYNVIIISALFTMIVFLVWFVIINIAFRPKHLPKNPASSVDANKLNDEVRQIIELYNNEEELINEIDREENVLNIYKRIYDKLKDTTRELNELKYKKYIEGKGPLVENT